MGSFMRGTRNVIRRPVRLVLIVILLGTCLLFVATAISLYSSIQTRIDDVNSQVGTGITVLPQRGRPFTEQQVTNIEHTPGLVSYAEQILGVACSSTEVHLPSPTATPPPAVAGGPSKPDEGGGAEEKRQNTATDDNNSEVKRNPGDKPGASNPSTANNASDATLTCYGFTPDSGADMKVKGSVPGGDALKVSAGRAFTNDDHDANVALIGSKLAQFNHLQPGSTFSLNGTSLKIIGLYQTGTEDSDVGVILPIQTAKRALNSSLSAITVYANSYQQVQTLKNSLHQLLGDQFQLSSAEGEFDQTVLTLNSIQRISLLALFLALAAALLIIVFTVFLTTRERRKEIAILKTLGASNWQIIRQFGIEVLAMSLLAAGTAAILLVIAGSWIAHAVSRTLPNNHGQIVDNAFAASRTLSVSLTPLNTLALLGIGVILAVLASLIPTWYIMRLRPALVLHTK